MQAGGPDIALDVWVTQEQEGLKGERHLRSLLLFHNPDAQSSVWATPPNLRRPNDPIAKHFAGGFTSRQGCQKLAGG